MKKILTLFSIIFIVLAAGFLFRYDVEQINGALYRFDRLTSTVEIMRRDSPDVSLPVKVERATGQSNSWAEAINKARKDAGLIPDKQETKTDEGNPDKGKIKMKWVSLPHYKNLQHVKDAALRAQISREVNASRESQEQRDEMEHKIKEQRELNDILKRDVDSMKRKMEDME